MPAQIRCPRCRTVQQVFDASIGYSTRCTRCGHAFVAKRVSQRSLPSPRVLMIGGAVVLGLAGLGGVGLLVTSWLSSGDSAADAVADRQPMAEQPQAKIYALKIEGPSELELVGGATQSLEFAVSRDGYAGPIELSVMGLPKGIKVKSIEIAEAKETGTLEFVASTSLGDGTHALRVAARAGESETDHRVDLATRAMPPMSLTVPAVARLHPDGSAAVAVTIARQGRSGAVKVQAQGLPKQVTASPVTIASGSDRGKLVLKGVKTPEKQYSVTLLARLGDESAKSSLKLNVERFAFRLQPIDFPVEWVAPGDSVEVPITILRRSYQGPVKIEVSDVPHGVTAEPLEIPANLSTGKLKLVATADAPRRVRSGRVIASVGGATSETLLIVRVKGEESSLLSGLKIDNEELAATFRKGSFGGRLNFTTKQTLLNVFGGTEQSERAVLEGLAWLADHQAEDGRWSLHSYHSASSGCNCKSSVEENVDKNDTAATAFGVLPFLGAGVTHNSAPDYPNELSEYSEVVKRGLSYLIRNQKRSRDRNNGHLGGRMYAHSLGTIALCEAYAISKDKNLRIPAQLAVRYLMEAQHTQTGGWGYGPRQVGDTSIVAWVVLAIRSGNLAGVPTKRSVLNRTEKFLDTTAAGPSPLTKSQYAYRAKPGQGSQEIKPKLSLTAAGLLARQYLGWQLDRKEFPAGADVLMKNLPPANSSRVGPNYYYYYATQVMHHLEGKNWDLWNHYMREHLIRTQQTEGHPRGSWSPVGSDYGARGGRIYTTSMCLLTLESYYRHLPLYRTIAKPQSAE